MTNGIDHYLKRVREDSYVDIFSASGLSMNPYPLRLGRYGDASGGIASRSDTYILDSAIGDPNVTNEDVLDRAVSMEADIVIPCDTLHDPRSTTEAVVDMVARIDDRDVDIDILVPLQSNTSINRCDHYDTLSHKLQKQGRDIDSMYIGVGGIRDLTPIEQIRAVASVRNHVGSDVWLHGLGLGATREWVVAVQQCPWLLDSLDTSSIAHDVSNGSIWGANVTRKNHDLPRGKNSTAVSALLMRHLLALLNYLMSPYPRENDIPTTTEKEQLQEILELLQESRS